jgi:hypothetical protein
MTSIDIAPHTPTAHQIERLWGLDAARGILASKTSAGFFQTATETVGASSRDLIKLADYLVGEQPDPVEDRTPAQRANELIDDLDPKSAAKIGLHALSHSDVPLVLMSNIEVLAGLDDAIVSHIIESSTQGLADLPRLIEEYRNRPEPESFETFLDSVREQFEAEQNLATGEEDGSLVVDEKQADKPDGEAEVAAEPKADDRG